MNMHRSGANAEPDFAMALSKIQHMSREELNDLLNDEAKLEDYVKSLDQVFIFLKNGMKITFSCNFILLLCSNIDQEFI